MNQIPEKINAFNAYNDADAMVGVSDEVSLPDFEAMSEKISGPGILGEIDSPTTGAYGSMEIEIPFRTLWTSIYDIANVGKTTDVTLRGSIQVTDPSTGAVDYVGMRVVVRGKCKKIKNGKLKAGSPMDASITLEILYILVEIDGASKIELDKLNFVYKVNGEDLLEKVRKQC